MIAKLPKDMGMTGSDRRQEIVDRSAQLFYENGYANVGMRMIADAIGIRTASLYYHFPSKEDILFQICLHETRDFVEAQRPILEDLSSPAEQVKAFFSSHIQRAWRERVKIVVTERETRELSEEHQLAVSEHTIGYRAMLEQYLSTLDGATPPASVDGKIVLLAAVSMINSVNGWFAADGPLSIEEVADRVSSIAADIVLRAWGLLDADEARTPVRVAPVARPRRTPAGKAGR